MARTVGSLPPRACRNLHGSCPRRIRATLRIHARHPTGTRTRRSSSGVALRDRRDGRAYQNNHPLLQRLTTSTDHGLRCCRSPPEEGARTCRRPQSVPGVDRRHRGNGIDGTDHDAPALQRSHDRVGGPHRAELGFNLHRQYAISRLNALRGYEPSTSAFNTLSI